MVLMMWEGGWDVSGHLGTAPQKLDQPTYLPTYLPNYLPEFSSACSPSAMFDVLTRLLVVRPDKDPLTIDLQPMDAQHAKQEKDQPTYAAGTGG